MSDCDEYEFRIGAYTPETIPMERLAAYLAALAKMFGHEANVHFNRIETGSTMPILRIDQEAAPKVAHRIQGISRGEAANDAIAGFNELNNLLRDDNAVGSLKWLRANAESGITILEFAGKNLPRPVKFGPFIEPTMVDGELVRIGGKDQSAHAQIVDPEGKTWSGELSRDLARRLAAYIYKGPCLRVTGDARWERREDGAWHLLSFRINGFDVLEDDDLESATARLRSMHSTDWANIEDIDSYIEAERGESDGLH